MQKFIIGINDAMDMLGGKWKPYIMASLYRDKKKYSENIEGCTRNFRKMLCRKLKEMAVDLLIEKKVSDSSSSFLYELTEYG